MTESLGPDALPFAATERFALVRELGSGGMGVVFEAEDKVRSSRVALKTLHRLNPTGLYRFKKEFRSLQSLAHPNLVTLYEFIADSGHWFFTMELVEGDDFLTYVRGPEFDDGTGSFRRPGQPGSQSATVSLTPAPVQVAAPCADCDAPVRSVIEPALVVVEPTTLAGFSSTFLGENAAGQSNSLTTTVHESGNFAAERELEPKLPATIDDIPANGPGRSRDSGATTENDRPAVDAATPRSPQFVAGGTEAAADDAASTRGPACDLVRLRAVLEQIAEGVNHLHESGMLHRDLKPSNVLVTAAGRVAILDFGLITEVDGSEASDRAQPARPAGGAAPEIAPTLAKTDHGLVVGTIRYMAPEQAGCQPLTRAADWYSFGVMMYEALVGELPFEGSASTILSLKRAARVTAPAVRRHGVPGELSSLCVRLLASLPDDRPTFAEIMAVLRWGSVRHDGPALADQVSSEHPFVGREIELTRLRDAYLAATQGSTVVALVQGRSGCGKSSLIERFLDRENFGHHQIVLKGRCYEQESVPFKAIDSLIDSLCRYLISRPIEMVNGVLPRDIGSLSRMFPVLKRVEAIAAVADLRGLPPDPVELRRRGFGALRELLTQLAQVCPVVLWIDDLQWGDLDSAELLSEIFRDPSPGNLLLIASCRSEYERENPCLTALLQADRRVEGDADIVRIDVGALTAADAERLAALLFQGSGALAAERSASIARESSGNPYLITEIARHFRAHSEVDQAVSGIDHGVSVQQILWARIERLPRELRAMLEVIAVAGKPLSQKSAYTASRLEMKDQAVLVQLRNDRLLRSTGPGIDDEIDVYHDQIRATVLDRLSEEARRSHHRHLADALEAAGSLDPETLAIHFGSGGQPARAAAYYREAARAADQAMAFDRAAGLYRRALELGSWPFPTEGRIKAELGDALANSRRGRESGQVYLEAASIVPAAESIELRRRAFQQLLTSGDHDVGIEVLRRVFHAVGLKYPETPGKALASAALGLARLRLRGLGMRARPPEAINADRRLELDVGWSGGLSLCLIDSARAAPIFIDNLLRGLQAGDALCSTRAMLAVSSLFAVRGRKGVRRFNAFVEQAELAMARVDDPNLRALHHMSRGLSAYAMGHWSRSLELNDQSAAIFRDHCTGTTISLEMAAYYSLRALCWLGNIAELRNRRAALLKEAEERRDLFSITNYRTEVMTHDLLADDDSAGAAHEIEDAMGQWSQHGFHAQHLFALVGNVRVDLYRGEGVAARQRIRDSWNAYRGSQLHRSCIGRIMIDQIIASSALATWADRARRAVACREASQAADRLDRERIDYAAALARMIRGRLAALCGDHATAMRFYRGAADQFRLLEMPLYEAATLFRLGELPDAPSGQSLVGQAILALESRQIRNPAAMIRVLLP